MSKVVSIFKNNYADYKTYIYRLDKYDLLVEMVQFQEDRARVGCLTIDMMHKGIILFRALEEASETNELRLLTRSYRRHLEEELKIISEPI